MAELSISLLGTVEVRLNNEPISSFRTKSVQALLIYLVCEAERPSSREQLMDLLWPSMPLKSAQTNLRQTTYRLRQTIPEVNRQNGEAVPFLITTRQTIQINPDADYFADVQTFTSLIEDAPPKAIKLYRGNFLADFFLPDSETFEEWANNQRELYRRQALEAMEQVTAVSIQNANYDQAIHFAQRQLEIDNLRESSHRQLMEALARNGRRQDALSHFNMLQTLLQDELAIKPSRQTHAIVDKIRADDFSDRDTDPPPHSTPNRPQHNLPRRVTSFIGREKEIEAVTQLLNTHPLVMLTGVGGIGKTNLCLQVGRNLQDTFADGVWLVELAPISNANLIAQTVATALGLRESAEHQILDAVLNFLQGKQCLLILDNCEHLINGVARFVQTVLQRCADVKILASSREALGLPGERPFHVPPLTIPEEDIQQTILTDWEQYEALRLFVERTQIVLPDFQVTADNIGSIVQICQRLDGIPLALELAAARMKILTTTQIAERLDDRFRLLTGGSRAALPRQQTLRALIDWSWDLLAAQEQQLLQRLSVFAGGMSLEAVEAICTSDDLQSYEIIDLFSELINKSLVVAQREQGQSSRYYLLETIRQYAQEQLIAANEAEMVRQKHLAYFQQLTKTAEPALREANQGLWLDRLEQELDNIRAALDWAQEQNVAAGITIISALPWLCWARGYWHEMAKRLAAMLANTNALDAHIMAKAIWSQGLFQLILYQNKQALTAFEESLALYRTLNDPWGIARSLRYLGFVLNSLEQVDQGQALLRESLELLRELGDKSEIAETLTLLGEQEIYNQNYELAECYLQEGQALFREANDFARLSWNLGKSGVLALDQEEYAEAQTLFEESLALQEELNLREGAYTLHHLGSLYYQLGDDVLAQALLERVLASNRHTEFHGSMMFASIQLGHIHLDRGNLTQAKQLFDQGLQEYKVVEGRNDIIFVAIEGVAKLAVKQEDFIKAAQLFAWTDMWRQEKNDPRQPIEQADVDRDIALILEMIDEETYAATYAEGKAMSAEQISAYALGDGE